jgi:hypothetical protein
LAKNVNLSVPLHGISYTNFINAIKSPATQKGYRNALRRYLNHLKQDKIDSLLIHISNPRYIESQIIDYIMSLRNSGVSYATIKVLTIPIFTFYQLNDVVLNRKKVSRYLGEYKRVVKDHAYTTEQIQTVLQNADVRMRMILLILSSTGARIGSLPGLVLGNLTKIPQYNLYKITFYESTNNEYYTFTTRECALTGIDNYLLYRQRCGEKICFNDNVQRWEPSDTPLIRTQFDIDDLLQVRNLIPMKLNALRSALTMHLVKSGLRVIEHPTDPTPLKRVRKSISLANGFRKHIISTFIEAGLNHEIRELLVDHATMLDQNYFRPDENQVLQEYLKAEPYLTIDPAARLAKENQMLRIEKSNWELMRQELDEIKEVLKRA